MVVWVRVLSLMIRHAQSVFSLELSEIPTFGLRGLGATCDWGQSQLKFPVDLMCAAPRWPRNGPNSITTSSHVHLGPTRARPRDPSPSSSLSPPDRRLYPLRYSGTTPCTPFHRDLPSDGSYMVSPSFPVFARIL